MSPLFLSETLDRELKAVDSENKKNLQNDNWRLSQLNKSLANPEHPYNHFSTGNLETLQDEPRKNGVDTRKEFMKFYDQHYSANRMKLVVLGKEPLDTLESWTGDLFAPVQNKDLPKNRWNGIELYTKKELLTEVFARPVMDQRLLDIYFPYQDEEEMFRTHPGSYISHLIGHEGPGSILAHLKSKGWANGLSSGAIPICPGSAFYTISIRLTPDGLKEYKEVVKVVFQYIAMLKESPPQRWIYEECKGLAEVRFRFKEKSAASRFTSKLSSDMQKPWPREWLLSGARLIREFDPAGLTKALSYLNTDNYRLTVVSQDFPGDWDRKERWYGTEYRMQRIPSDFEDAIHKAGRSTAQERPSDLHLPHRNEFIPTRLNVERKEVPEPAKAPKLIRKDEGLRLWWKKDDQFWVPKANVEVSFRNPLVSVTPANACKVKFYCELVKDVLEDYAYDAEIAGLGYTLHSTSHGIELGLSGFSDKMSVLLEKILLSMRDLDIKRERFDIIKERLIRGYQNFSFQEPYKQIGSYSQWLGSERGWVNEQYLAELPHIMLDDVAVFYPHILRQVHIEIQVHGNMYKEDALRVADLIESALKPRSLPQSQWLVRRNLILPEGSDCTYRKVLGDPANVNNCIEYYIFVGSYAEHELRAKLLLLGQLTSEQGFDQLRTKEQLGYIVFTGAKMSATTMGYRVLVQSERSPEYLEERINAFLISFAKTLEEMSETDFNNHKRSLINKRLERPKNLDQESSKLWSYISTEYFNFNQVDIDVANIKALGKSDLTAFFDHYIKPTSPHRAKLSVHMATQTSPKEVKGNMTLEEQKDKVISLIAKFLTSLGVDGHSSKLKRRFDAVDVAGGDLAGTVTAITNFVLEDLRLPAGKCETITKQSQEALATALPALGIQIKVSAEESSELTPAPPMKPTTYIEDVHAWKASHEVSTGPRPLTDLSEYEDFEPKL